MKEGTFDLKAWQADNKEELEKARMARASYVKRKEKTEKDKQRSRMAAKSASGQAVYLPPDRKPFEETFPRVHFIHGDLTDPGVLSRVLGLEEEPEFRLAQVMGYCCMFWGCRPALVEKRHASTSGVVYQIQNPDHAQKMLRFSQEDLGRDTSVQDHPQYDPTKFETRCCGIQT